MRYEEPYKELTELFKEPMFDEATKYTKEFIRDSLILRFKEQQSLAFEAIMSKFYSKSHNGAEAREKVFKEQERELMRFIQILDLLFVERDNR